MSRKNICILGGTGFVGRPLVARLVSLGHRVSVLTRQRERHRDLLVLPTVQVLQADVHNPVQLRRAFQDHDVVINLVGILNERGRGGKEFTHTHAELPGKVVQACRQVGVKRLLHMGALHASPQGPSHYLRSKAQGEERVLQAASESFHVSVFRPSVIFGRHDSFTNRFAKLLRYTPGVFPLACARARLQPIFVGDVVRVFVESIDNPHTYGRAYNLCGPEVYSLQELVAYLAEVIGVRRRILPLNDFFSRLQATLFDYLPGRPFTRDNYLSLQVASICNGDFPAVFGFTPTAFKTVVPGYLAPNSPHVSYST